MKYRLPVFFGIFCMCVVNASFANRGAFDLERWDNIISGIRTKAVEQNISKSVIDEALKSPSIVPGIINRTKINLNSH